MVDESGMIKLYFEEIDPIDDDGDAAAVIVEEDYDENERNQRECVDTTSSNSINLSDGGVLQNLSMDAFGKGSKPLATNIRVPVTAKVWQDNQGNGPDARGGCSLAATPSHLILFGGATRNGIHFNDVWRVPIQQDGGLLNGARWEDVTNVISGQPPTERSGHTSTMFQGDSGDNVMIVFGGLNPVLPAVFNDVYCLRACDDNLSWTQVSTRGTAPRPRTEHSATAVGQQLVVFGGSSPAAGLFRDVHVLDLSPLLQTGNTKAVCTWSTIRCGGPPPTPREMHTACLVINNKDDAFTSPQFSHYGSELLDPTQARRTLHQDGLQKSCYQNALDNSHADTETESNEARSLREQGNALFVKGDLAGAAKLYTEALEAFPWSHLAYGNRSACHLALGEPKVALRDAICAVRLNPTWAKGYFREAAACAAMDLKEQAAAAMAAAVECASNETERAKMLAQVKALIPEKNVTANNDRAIDLLRNEMDHSLVNKAVSILVFGGRGSEGVLNDFAVLDLELKQWRRHVVETPFPRCGHSCTLLSGRRLLLVGGWDGGRNVFHSALEYNLDSKMWTETQVKGHDGDTVELAPRFSHAAIRVPLSGDQVAIFGGVNFETDNSDLVVINVAAP